MKILGLDTSGGTCGCCFYNTQSGQIISRHEELQNGHAERLIPMTQEVLAEAGAGFDELDSVIATLGPGGFTGVRVGLMSAKSLAMALSIPLYGVSTFQAYAWQYAQTQKTDADRDIICALDSRRDEFFVQVFDASGMAKSDPQLMSLQRFFENFCESTQADQYSLIGNYTPVLKKELSLLNCSNIKIGMEHVLVDPSILCVNVHNLKDIDLRDVHPIYLRDADTSAAKQKPRVLETKR